MTANLDKEKLKRQAGEYAAAFVQSGMVVGLGEGSTAVWAIRKLAQRVRDGELRDILGVPCSKNVETNARALGLPLTTLDAHPVVDITIDGADEVDPQFNLIKGGGGALLREKIVAQATRREIIVVDEGKLSDALGVNWAVPIEVLPFGWPAQQRFLESLGATVTQRQRNGTVFITDQGNYILDARFAPIRNPATLAAQLGERAGIVEHGLFIALTNDVIVAGSDGIKHLTRP